VTFRDITGGSKIAESEPKVYLPDGKSVLICRYRLVRIEPLINIDE